MRLVRALPSLALAAAAACHPAPAAKQPLTPVPASASLAAPAAVPAPRIAPAFAPAAWDVLIQRLPGRWIATTTTTTGTSSVAVEFHLVSRQSVMLETFGSPGRQTTTVYHRDAGDLVATHYCAQGNQPRLRLHAGDALHPVLTFADATDLDAGESALVELSFDFTPAQGFDRVEVYRQPDGTLDRTAWQYRPAPPS